MKMKKLRMLLLATLALCACSSGGDGAGDSPGVPNPPTGDKRLPISIGMTMNDRENTRVTDLAFEVGDQIGYIEAMKMFNDLKSDVSGIVREIVVANGEDVELIR